MTNAAGASTLTFLIGACLFVGVVAFGTWRAASAGGPRGQHRHWHVHWPRLRHRGHAS